MNWKELIIYVQREDKDLFFFDIPMDIQKEIDINSIEGFNYTEKI